MNRYSFLFSYLVYVLVFFISIISIYDVGAQSGPLQTINPENIEIVRDQWGLPHIYAQYDYEVAYGVAWVQGEDHFEMLQQTLLFAKGLLGRVYGKDGAAGDFFNKFLRIDELVEKKVKDDVSVEFMHYLDGFCQGINAYAKCHPKEVLHRKVFPVAPEDLLASYPLKIAEFIGMGSTISAILNGKPYDAMADNMDLTNKKGSNAFAISRKLTSDGRTYLICNPHVSISGQEAFYEIHVNSEEGLNFHGAMFPGSVSPQIGTNQHLGWSHTNNYYDHTDVFLLEMHPDEPLKYRFDDQWLDLEDRKIKLTVKLKGLPFPLSVKRKVYWSKYGPTLESKVGHFIAIRMAPIFTIKTAEQWFKMNKASNYDEFSAALSWNGLPYFNITYADKDDNVFYIFNGLFPERSPGYDWKKMVPGNTSETLWNTYVPLDERPQILNPECGYVFNVNHNPFKCTCTNEWLHKNDYDSLVRYDLRDDNTRSLRFRELFTARKPLSMEQLKAIKYDVKWPEADPVTKLIRELQAYENDSLTDVLTYIKDWDLNNYPESVAPTLLFLARSKLSSRRTTSNENIRNESFAEALQYARDHLVQHFGKIDVPWKDFSRIRRGDKDLPVYGYDDMLGNRWSKLDAENGKAYTTGGDNFMMFVKYDADGVAKLESIVPFGNSSVAGNPHYNDQMELYSTKKAKSLTFDKEKIFNNAERIYHPE